MGSNEFSKINLTWLNLPMAQSVESTKVVGLTITGYNVLLFG